MYILYEYNVFRYGILKFVSCIILVGLGFVVENLLIIVFYDLVFYLVKVKDFKIMFW